MGYTAHNMEFTIEHSTVQYSWKPGASISNARYCEKPTELNTALVEGHHIALPWGPKE